MTETRRRFEGAERTVVRMENERVVVEVVPELEGRVITYADKVKPKSGFEWLDDCAYHFGGRWEGVPFQYKVDARGPDRAAVTVSGGGKIAVALLRQLTGADVASPLDLRVERTMSITPGSSKLTVDVKITNVGDGVAPALRYMVHAVFGQVPQMPGGGRAYWFLPTGRAVEFFDDKRGGREMGQASGGAPVDHPFSRFVPGRKADKPRYEAGGWGAVLTSAGPVYIQYDAKEYDFMQYWFGGDSEWHYTFEPHTKPVDLKPGESVRKSFALAYDSKDVAFTGPTVAYEQPVVPEVVLPGGTLQIKARATTVLDHAEQAKVAFDVRDPKGQTVVDRTVAGEVRPFALTDLSAEVKLPADAGLGAYAWRMRGADGKELAAGKFEIVTADEQAKRVTERATAALRLQLEALRKEAGTRNEETRRYDELWREGVNLALTWNDERTWPDGAAPRGAVGVAPDAAGVPVLGNWRAHEAARIKSLAPVAPLAWPPDAARLLATLGADAALVRDVAADADGKGLVVLLIDAAKNRVQVARIGAGGVKRFGEFSDKPGEADAKLGAGSRALAVDREGNVWVATSAWGKISVLGVGADGSPFEQAVIGPKGALKKFGPDGKFLAGIGLLAPPSDLALATADGSPVVLASYRHVSKYHTTQVREGALVVRATDAERVAELKVPGGSIAVDKDGRVWAADVAGHLACYDARGHKAFDVKGTPPPAVPEAVLPAGSPLPVIVRAAEGGGVRALSTLRRTMVTVVGAEAPAAGVEVPANVGALWRLAGDGVVVVIGEKGIWKP